MVAIFVRTDKTIDIIAQQGATWNWTLNCISNGSAMQLTGYSVRGQIRKSYTSSTVVAEISCSITNESLGEISCSVSASTSSGITACTRKVTESNYLSFSGVGVYVLDIEIYKGTPETVYNVFSSNLFVNPEVTKSS